MTDVCVFVLVVEVLINNNNNNNNRTIYLTFKIATLTFKVLETGLPPYLS